MVNVTCIISSSELYLSLIRISLYDLKQQPACFWCIQGRVGGGGGLMNFN